MLQDLLEKIKRAPHFSKEPHDVLKEPYILSKEPHYSLVIGLV